VTTPAAPRSVQLPTSIVGRGEHRFFVSIGLVVVLLSIIGFVPSIVDPSLRNGPPTLLVVSHGLLTGSWLLLYVLQVSLVANRRIPLHRRLGVAGALLALAAVVVGCLAIFVMLRRGYDLSGDIARGAGPPGSRPPGAIDSWIPFGEFLTFGALVAAGIWYRHRAEVHKRLMLLAVASLALEPLFHFVGYVTGRWPAAWTAAATGATIAQLLLLVAVAIRDRLTLGRIHPVSLWGPVLIVVLFVFLGAVVAPSAPWRSFATWLAG
jgi:hypothetical protein